MFDLYLLGWCLLGIVGFFLARAAWSLQFGCKPITIGTLSMLLVFMWVPPFTFLVAFIWWGLYLHENGSPTLIERILRKEIVNPCKWFK